MKKTILIILFMFLALNVRAQETIISYEENSLPVLNEELRKKTEKIAKLEEDLAETNEAVEDSEQSANDYTDENALSSGNWDDSIYSSGTAYQSDSDAMIFSSVNASAGTNTRQLITYQTGSTSSVADLSQQVSHYNGNNGSVTTLQIVGFCKKDDYWKITDSTSGDGSMGTIYYIPLNSNL